MAQDIPHDPVDSGQRQLTIGVPKETVSGEKRVALIPETVSRLAALGVDLLVEAGAGEGSAIDDDEYVAAQSRKSPHR